MKKDVHKILGMLEKGARILSLSAEDSSPVQKAFDFLLGCRFSSAYDLESSLSAQVCKKREDYPSLSTRSIHAIPNGNVVLSGYLYECDLPKGLIVYVHGLRGQADDFYAIGQDYFLRHGYDVFAIDLSSSGRSTGQGVDSLSQGALDVAAAAVYASKLLPSLPLYLFGHSWGGYSVVASTHFCHRPLAVASLSGFSSPVKEMVGLPSERTGLAVAPDINEVIEIAKRRCPSRYDLSAYEAIKENPDIRYFVAIGEKDVTVPVEKASLYGELIKSPLSNAETRLLRNKYHMDVFLTPEAGKARQEALDYAREFGKENGKNFALYDKQKKEEFLSHIDIEKTSKIDEVLFGDILDFYERSAIIDC